MSKLLKCRVLCIAFLLVLALHGAACAQTWKDVAALDRVFKDAGVVGTFVLYDVSGDVLTGYNRTRAEKRFVPASTFKIPNTLIGLWSGAVKDVDEVLPYGGKPQYMKEWERDMGLREAIRLSNVPIYQALARRIGLEKMREGVKLLDYGNKTIGNVVDVFWLEGPLEISAVEQVRFLARLAQGELPFSKEHQAQVRNILKQEEGEGWALYAKTGIAVRDSRRTGWWVGWVEKEGRIYPFAVNIAMKNRNEAGKRIEIGRRCLSSLGIL